MKGQCGISSRFTAEQIAEVKRMDDEYRRVVIQRNAMMRSFGMTRDEWSRYARGIIGKKPARQAA
jgi:hypothetical protein